MSRKQFPKINAGSMADIAFLLLIFFLVTTTMEVDSGILRKIPEKRPEIKEILIKNKNILEVDINSNNIVFVEDNEIDISELKQIVLNFIDNGGGSDKSGQPCSWCKGAKDPTSSDHPSKAFISIKAQRKTTYETYIAVLDNIYSAYTVLRDRLSKELYTTSYIDLVKKYQRSKDEKEKIYRKIKVIQEKYPLLVSDSEITH